MPQSAEAPKAWGGRYRFLISAAVCVALAAILYPFFSHPLRSLFEDATYLLSPSPGRAYQVAERAFNASDARAYDIDRAEYFFQRIAEKNPEYPAVYHELARIAFLRGDYDRALTLIDLQIKKHADALPNSYYIRGLILGYLGRYDAAAESYEKYLMFDAQNWAAINDYAWVLLKSGRFEDARTTSENGLSIFPNNPWLLNTSAIALFETAEFLKAYERAAAAEESVMQVTESDWLTAYPGNDPKFAHLGLATLRSSIAENMHRIENILTRAEVQ